jgi:endonuclease/exonuclease/phosphatase family metal-dependent hydrolase
MYNISWIEVIQMKIMTFNARIDVGVDGLNQFPYRLKGIVDFIKKENCDIIGFQEVNRSMLERLIEVLYDYDFVGKSRNNEDEYNPIFYKKIHRVLSTSTVWLSNTPNVPGSKHPDAYFPRIYTTLSIKIDNQIYEVVNTHLSHISHQARIDGMKALMEHYKNTNHKNFILMGDFNATPDQGVDDIIGKKLISCWQDYKGDKLTFHDFTGQTRGLPIDYIFTSKDILVRAVKVHHDKYYDKFLSDHYPVSIII